MGAGSGSGRSLAGRQGSVLCRRWNEGGAEAKRQGIERKRWRKRSRRRRKGREGKGVWRKKREEKKKKKG